MCCAMLKLLHSCKSKRWVLSFLSISHFTYTNLSLHYHSFTLYFLFSYFISKLLSPHLLHLSSLIFPTCRMCKEYVSNIKRGRHTFAFSLFTLNNHILHSSTTTLHNACNIILTQHAHIYIYIAMRNIPHITLLYPYLFPISHIEQAGGI